LLSGSRDAASMAVLEACGFDGGDGTIHDALVALLDQRPVAVVYAATDREIAARIGGFERAGVAHDGRLAKLSTDAAADGVVMPPVKDGRNRRRDTPAGNRARESRNRRARAVARQAKAEATTATTVTAPLPAIVVRAVGQIGDLKSAPALAVLHRDPPPRRDDDGLLRSGRARLGPLSEHLKSGFGVHVLQTSHALRHLGLTKTGADHKIEEKLAGGELGVPALLAIGCTHLQNWTGFDSAEELANFSREKYRTLEKHGHALPTPDRQSRINAELDHIPLLSSAYTRAKTILRTFEQTRTASDARARVEIGAAFGGTGSDVSAADLISLAMVADINPIPLWPSHAEVSAESFEVLRFLGRIQRGSHAVLLREHFDLVRRALARQRTLAEEVISGVLSSFFELDEILGALGVAASGDALVITRRTREFAIATRDGTTH
jgi:hypothetical protein